MKKLHFKHPLLNIILGALLAAFAIVAMFITDWLAEFTIYVIGALVVILSLVRFNKDYRSYKNSQARMILAVELILALLAGGLILFREADAGHFVGFVLYLRGFVYFLILQLLRSRGTFEKFLLYMAILTLGAYVLFTGNIFLEEIHIGIFILLIAYAVFLIYIGIDQKLKTRKQS